MGSGGAGSASGRARSRAPRTIQLLAQLEAATAGQAGQSSIGQFDIYRLSPVKQKLPDVSFFHIFAKAMLAFQKSTFRSASCCSGTSLVYGSFFSFYIVGFDCKIHFSTADRKIYPSPGQHEACQLKRVLHRCKNKCRYLVITIGQFHMTTWRKLDQTLRQISALCDFARV